MLDFFTALWLGFIGGCIGSFLNVVAYRMPLGMSVIWKPSHCPKCDHPIRARDNVPVLGWLMLRGKCRDCGEPISPRYAIVEFAMAAAFFILAYVELFSGGANLPGGPITEFTGAIDIFWIPQWDLIGVYAYHCTLIGLLMCILLIDRDRQEIPLKLMACALLLGFVPPLFWPHLYPTLPHAPNFGKVFLIVLSGLATGVFFGALLLWKSPASQKTRGFSGLTLLAIIGLFLGWQAVFYLWAAIIFPGIVWGLGNYWLDRSNTKSLKLAVSLIWVVIFTVLLLLAWRPIAELLPL